MRVKDRITNRVRGRVKLTNYSLITVLPVVTSADPLIRYLPWPGKLLNSFWEIVLAVRSFKFSYPSELSTIRFTRIPTTLI